MFWIIILVLWLISTAIIGIWGASANSEDSIPYLLNPILIYKECNKNIYICILYTLLAHLLFPYYAVYYWTYKLITLFKHK